MNTYEYQRSRSLFDLCQRSLRFIILNIYCCEAARPIEAKFHIELLWVGRMKICSKGCWSCDKDGCPYMVKILQKSSSPKPAGWLLWNLVYSIWDSGGGGGGGPTKIVQMMILGWPWPTLQQGQLCSLMLLYGKNIYTPCKLCLWWGILFSHCPSICPCVHPWHFGFF